MASSDVTGSKNFCDKLTAEWEGQTVTINADATDQSYGLYLKSANGTIRKLSMSDAGALTAEDV